MQTRPYGKVSLWIIFNSKCEVQRELEGNRKIDGGGQRKRVTETD